MITILANRKFSCVIFSCTHIVSSAGTPSNWNPSLTCGNRGNEIAHVDYELDNPLPN